MPVANGGVVLIRIIADPPKASNETRRGADQAVITSEVPQIALGLADWSCILPV